MKNYEKYADEIRNIKSQLGWCDSFAEPKILAPIGKSCKNTACSHCTVLTLMWLMEEYEEPEEPETDWSEVEIDTPILVKQDKTGDWLERHFAKYENGLVYAWNNGETSWTTVAMTDWNYAKLAEDEKEPEIDWSKVKVDTPILVRDDGVKWVKRHFAKYENGGVYAWKDNHTSWTSLHNDDVTFWNYAKLAEDEE